MGVPFRIFHTAKPMQVTGPLLPMEPEQERFWQLRRARNRKDQRDDD